jgi:hypothetical protein
MQNSGTPRGAGTYTTSVATTISNANPTSIDDGTQFTMTQNATSSGSCSMLDIFTAGGGGESHVESVFRAHDPTGPWTSVGPVNHNLFAGGSSSFIVHQRLGANNWKAYGISFLRGTRQTGFQNPQDLNIAFYPHPGIWTDNGLGLNFTRPDPQQYGLNTRIPVGFPGVGVPSAQRVFQWGPGYPVNIGGQMWMCAAEDRRSVYVVASPGSGTGYAVGDAVFTKKEHGYASGDQIFFEQIPGYEAFGATMSLGSNIISDLAYDATTNLCDRRRIGTADARPQG